MGIIVLAVAVMPMLGIMACSLLAGNTRPHEGLETHPESPRLRKPSGLFYLGLTVSCAIAYWLAGMTVFDAVGHAFSTVAIGGFSTHDQSLGFQQPAILIIATAFMLISAVNFALHFTVFKTKSQRPTSLIPRLGVFCIRIRGFGDSGAHPHGIRELSRVLQKPCFMGTFQVVSIGTTTGFTTTGYHWWPSFLPIMLIIMSAVGGCAGSTAGGMKVIRLVLLYKQGKREISQLIHPSALITVKLGNKPVPTTSSTRSGGFFALYILSYVGLFYSGYGDGR